MHIMASCAAPRPSPTKGLHDAAGCGRIICRPRVLSVGAGSAATPEGCCRRGPLIFAGGRTLGRIVLIRVRLRRSGSSRRIVLRSSCLASGDCSRSAFHCRGAVLAPAVACAAGLPFVDSIKIDGQLNDKPELRQADPAVCPHPQCGIWPFRKKSPKWPLHRGHIHVSAPRRIGANRDPERRKDIAMDGRASVELAA